MILNIYNQCVQGKLENLRKTVSMGEKKSGHNYKTEILK